MKSSSLLLFLFSLLAISSCEQYTPAGFAYELVRETGSPKMVPGDEAFVYFQISIADTVLFRAPQEGLSVKLTNLMIETAGNQGPAVDVLPMLGEGDSAIVYRPITDDMRENPLLANSDALRYEVSVRKVIPPGDDQAEASAAYRKAHTPKEEVVPIPAGYRADLVALDEVDERLRLLDEFIGQAANEDPGLSQTESGLIYRMVRSGRGKKPVQGEPVRLHYIGALADGTIFAETFVDSNAFAFVYNEGRVIKAWDEAVGLLRGGGSMLLATPPELAYGKLGKVPYIRPNVTLYFYLEVDL